MRQIKALSRMLFTMLLLVSGSLFAEDNQVGFTLTPAPNDLSITLLRHVFGTVGTVLFGSSTQIVGEMFAVYNKAVLVLAGILMFYTTIVAIMNTAHEGEFMGRRFSSIWVPMRTVVGVVFLLPNAGGYSYIQVLVMWLVVQGVGAADSIWRAALNYLERGGVLCSMEAPKFRLFRKTTQEDMDYMINGVRKVTVRHTSYTRQEVAPNDRVSVTAAQILRSQVCMGFVQEAFRLISTSGPKRTELPAGAPSTGLAAIPGLVLPSFPGSGFDINQLNNNSGKLVVPNYNDTPYYEALNGLCGTFTWDNQARGQTQEYEANRVQSTYNWRHGFFGPWEKTGESTLGSEIRRDSFGDSIKDYANNYGSRYEQGYVVNPIVAAIQQMWFQSSGPAQQIVQNALNDHPMKLGRCAEWFGGSEPVSYSDSAKGMACKKMVDNDFLSSNLLQDLKSSYQGVLMPFLNVSVTGRETGFLKNAKETGWILAGSFVWDLLKLNKKVRDDFSFENLTPTVSGPVFSDPTAALEGLKRMCHTIKDSDRCLSYVTLIGRMFGKNGDFDQYLKAAVFFDPNFGRDFSQTYAQQLNPFTGLNMDVTINVRRSGTLKTPSKYIMPFLFGVFSLINRTTANINAMQNDNPLVMIALLGNDILSELVEIYVIGAAELFLGTLLLGALPSVAFGQAINSVLLALMPLLLALYGACFMPAFLMAYYIPLIPFIVFFFGAIGWFVGVIEAMVSAPLIAFGISWPEGNDVFGRAEYAIMPLINVFLRPGLMIIGYIAALSLTYAGWWLLQAGFSYAWGASPHTMGPFGIFSGVGELVLFCALSLALIQKACMIIPGLPDRVMRWIGGQPEHQGSEAAQMAMQKAESGAAHAGHSGGRAADALMQGATEGGQGAGRPIGEFGAKKLEERAKEREKKSNAAKGGAKLNTSQEGQEGASGAAGASAPSAVPPTQGAGAGVNPAVDDDEPPPPPPIDQGS